MYVYTKKRRGIMAKNVSAKKDAAKNTNVVAAAVAAKKTETPVAAAKSEPVKEKVVEKNEPAKKTLGRRGRKAEAKKPVAKKNADRIQEVYFEFDGGQVEAGQIVKKVEEDYKAAGHQIGRIKDLKIYVKPEDNKAYYVVNGNAEGASVGLTD
jgi:hypothetical protein